MLYRYQIRDLTDAEKKIKKPVCALMVAQRYIHFTPELFSVPMLYENMEIVNFH